MARHSFDLNISAVSAGADETWVNVTMVRPTPQSHRLEALTCSGKTGQTKVALACHSQSVSMLSDWMVASLSTPLLCAHCNVLKMDDKDWTALMSNRTMYFHVLLEAE